MRGIAICGFKAQLIIGPIYSNKLGITDELILLYSNNKQSTNVLNTVIDTLNDKINDIQKIEINDMFNFYEIYFTVLNLANKKEIGWVNVTAGPGVSLIALSLGILNGKKSNVDKVKYVYYHEPKDNMPGQTDIIDPINIDIFNLKKNKKYSDLFFKIFNELYTYDTVEDITIQSLASKFKKSQSTISRAINTLIEMQFVEYTGSGHGNSKKVFKLTELGKKMNSYIIQYKYSQ